MAFSTKYVLALVAIIFAQTEGGVVSTSEDLSTPLQELLDTAKAQLGAITEEWNILTGAVNFNELKTVLDANIKILENRAKSIIEDLKRQYEKHAPELSAKSTAAVKDATTSLNQVLEQLKGQAHVTIEEASALQHRYFVAFKSTAETMFEETGKLAKAAGEDVSSVHAAFMNFSKSALTQTMDVVQQLHNDAKKVVTIPTS